MKKILYVDMDNVLVDFPSAFPLLPEETRREYDDRLDEVPGIFDLMKPLPHAVEAFQELSLLYDAYILSTSPWENPSAWSDKLLWVKRHLGKNAYKRLILSHHKNLNQGHFLIDDRTKNGADKFTGKHILFGSPEFPDWPAIVSYLRENANTQPDSTPTKPTESPQGPHQSAMSNHQALFAPIADMTPAELAASVERLRGMFSPEEQEQAIRGMFRQESRDKT